jgi:hypothetical protein
MASLVNSLDLAVKQSSQGISCDIFDKRSQWELVCMYGHDKDAPCLFQYLDYCWIGHLFIVNFRDPRHFCSYKVFFVYKCSVF